ncbi:hypothetical protein GQ53DRAFT_744929 [Thozetella sp. PMI_491]|nr:hypothetical protein GQ53DRAFT_744929 [Thozetella sp. PMI_491]
MSSINVADTYDSLHRPAYFDPFDGRGQDDGRGRPPDAVDVWELVPEGSGQEPSTWAHRTCHPSDLQTGVAQIIFAPYPTSRTGAVARELLKKFDIPPEFAEERRASVCHSIGSHEGRNGPATAWFHVLFKNISATSGISRTSSELVKRRSPESVEDQRSRPIPETHDTWYQSGYCLSVEKGSLTPTLLCFGATRGVKERLRKFRGSALSELVAVKEEPYALLDVIVYGLFDDVNEIVWRMCDKLNPSEEEILSIASSTADAQAKSQINFAVLHNYSKLIIHLRETVDACILLVDGLKGTAQLREPHCARARQQLIANLAHRRSLFDNLRLRLLSLQRRVDNAIGLAFNLVAQQDAMAMAKDANSMKIITVITMVFLPTTAVASVLGSNLFTASLDEDSNSWNVQMSPLFRVLWMVACPLTVAVMIMAIGWGWWTQPGTREHLATRFGGAILQWPIRSGRSKTGDSFMSIELGVPRKRPPRQRLT